MRPARRQALKVIGGLAVGALFPSIANADTAFVLDDDGCIVVPVMINGRGPFQFVLDTGSNRTVITPEVASDLGLTVSRTGQQVLGVGGAADAGLVRLDRVEIGPCVLPGLTAMVMPSDPRAGMFGAAHGAIGMDGFAGRRLLIDLEDGAYEISDGGEATPSGFEIVPGRLRYSHLLEIPIDVGGFAARAVIDTGAQKTIANDLLLTQGVSVRDPRRFVIAGARGVTAPTNAARLDQVKLGPLVINQLLAHPGELPVLHGPDGKPLPALFLGMDALGLTRGFAIDFARAELQVRLDPRQVAWARWAERG